MMNNMNNNSGDKITNTTKLIEQIETYFKDNKLEYVVTPDTPNQVSGPDQTNRKNSIIDIRTAGSGTHGTTNTVVCPDSHDIICIETINIDHKISTVADLITLCEKYKIAENVHYNINMTALHNICPYLRELDNMIGMQTVKATVVDQIIYFIQNLHIPTSQAPGCVISNKIPIFGGSGGGGSNNQDINPFCFTGGQPKTDTNTNTTVQPLFQFPNLFGSSSPASNSASIASVFSDMKMPKFPKPPLSTMNVKPLTPSGDFMHTVLYGPPGTGKTEVAKILGNIFSHLGILKSRTFKKVTRSDLIAGYLGQTAIKTREVINSAIGGVLFIDEAYALGNTEKRDSFSKECIDTLCEALSDHKHELMVIIAGYDKELNECFFNYNEGLNSRFTWRYKIDNYTSVDLRKIFEKTVRDNNWTFVEPASTKDAWFKEHYDYFKYFGRDIEVFFTKTKIAHSRRIFCRPENEKRVLTMKDLETGFALFSQNDDVKNRGNGFGASASTLYL
jgi:hypothetical protein